MVGRKDEQAKRGTKESSGDEFGGMKPTSSTPVNLVVMLR